MKKQRSDAVLKTLPPGLQAELFARCNAASYTVVKGWLREAHGITTSEGALSKFYAWFPLSRRLEQAATFADSLKTQLSALPSMQGRAEEISDVTQIAFEMQAVQEQDGELYYNLRKLRLKERDQKLVERRIKLLEQKAAQADAAQSVTADQALTPAEREAKLKEIFGLK
jgi:hypothetical protein